MSSLISGAVPVNNSIQTSQQPNQKVMKVHVSELTYGKAFQLYKFIKYSAAKYAWGKDKKLLQGNPLLVSDSRNYTVLLAMGRNRQTR